MEENIMTLEQKMTLKAILEGDYNITRLSYRAFTDLPEVRIYIEGKEPASITPDGKITQTQQVEVEL